MTDWNVNESEVAELYQHLDKIGCLGGTREAGFLRAAYSDEETAAMKFIEKRAVENGASAVWDAIGNLCLEWPGKSGRFVEIGSHVDTVPFGGNFDGAGGIVAGLLAIKKILKSGISLNAGMRLRIWRGEESATFNTLYIGSSGAFGKFNAKSLTNKFRGITVEEAMKTQGIDVEVLRQGKRTISQDVVDRIVAHVELHIEQGNLLEVQGLDIGIVTSIRGPRRFRIVLEGEFDHSGATPMGIDYRRDVNLALGHIVVRLNDLATSALESGKDLVQTVGVINSSRDFNESNSKVYENAIPKVSGFGYFCLDVRSASESFLDGYCREAEQLIVETANEFRVRASIEAISRSTPLESVDAGIQEEFNAAAKKLGISCLRMPSGAGHDTAIVGAQMRSDGSSVPVGMIFIPCRNGKSHCPEEFATDLAIAKGASVMACALSKFVSAG